MFILLNGKRNTESFCYFIQKIFRFEGTLGQEKKTKFKANLANQTCLTDISEQFSIAIVYQWLDTIIASLDCYTWVFSQGFLNPVLFQGTTFRIFIIEQKYIVSF